jgi:hypothetical protein
MLEKLYRDHTWRPGLARNTQEIIKIRVTPFMIGFRLEADSSSFVTNERVDVCILSNSRHVCLSRSLATARRQRHAPDFIAFKHCNHHAAYSLRVLYSSFMTQLWPHVHSSTYLKDLASWCSYSAFLFSLLLSRTFSL